MQTTDQNGEGEPPFGNPVSLAIVIVAYMQPQLVDACLRSIIMHNDIGRRLEVVVVDNSPNHEVCLALSPQAYAPELFIRFIANLNKGFGQGNNVGLSYTDAPIVLFLNPDTQLTEPILVYALDRFQRHATLGTLGVQLYGPDGSKRMSFFWIDRFGVTANLLIKVANRLRCYSHGRMFTSGAALFARRKAMREAGGFDERIFLYHEEQDLFKRIIAAGYKTAFDSNKGLLHLEGGGKPASIQSLRHRLDSLEYYCLKYGLDYRRRIRSELRLIRLRRMRRRPGGSAAVQDAYENMLREQLNALKESKGSFAQ